ncbi:MAG: hypothetical protein MJ252_18720, partial [archaeon]|nr:hypothetical protein [archaeon]
IIEEKEEIIQTESEKKKEKILPSTENEKMKIEEEKKNNIEIETNINKKEETTEIEKEKMIIEEKEEIIQTESEKKKEEILPSTENEKMKIEEENKNENNFPIDQNISKEGINIINQEDKLISSEDKPITPPDNTPIKPIEDNTNSNIKKQSDLEEDPNIKIESYHYFLDETQNSAFVRRHAWSPDGSLCLLVSGIVKENPNTNQFKYVVWGVTRTNLNIPSFYIPTLDKCSICIKFCPLLFKKKEEIKDNSEESDDSEEPPLLDSPFIMVFAIGTADSVFIYTTESIIPKYSLTNIHYLPISDMSWKEDKMIAISSEDGYITFLKFEKEEFGTVVKPEEIKDERLKNNYETYLNVDINKNIMNTNYVTTIIKPKVKEEEEEKKEGVDGNNININNINNTSSNKDDSGNCTIIQTSNGKKRITPIYLTEDN